MSLAVLMGPLFSRCARVDDILGTRRARSPVVASVVVLLGGHVLFYGDTVTAFAEVRDTENRVMQSAQVTWRSADGTTAAVSLQGVVTGMAPGTTDIIAEVAGVSGLAPVFVLDSTSSLTGPAVEPELPRDSVDVSLRPSTRTLTVQAGGNLQAALDSAQRGDEIVLAAGATFTGNFEAPPKPGTSAQGWITVRSSNVASLPPLGGRIDAMQHAVHMATLATPNTNYALAVLPGASGWRFLGIEVTATPRAAVQPAVNYGLLLLGAGDRTQNTLAQAPFDLILDRVYVHGQPTTNSTRCVALNSGTTAIIGSALLECHAKGYDSQAIGGWNGPGPYLIENNRLEAAGEIIMFGGSDPPIPNLTTSDVTIRRNYLYRPMSWKGVWTVKNLFELKNAQRVLVEGNVMENNWVDGQAGFAVLLGTVNQEGRCTWCVVQDVTVRYNHIHNSAGGFNILERCGRAVPGGSYGCGQGGQPSRRIAIRHNLLTNIGERALGTNGRMYQLNGQLDDLAIENNTGFAPNIYIAFGDDVRPMARFSFRNNIGGEAEYPVHGAKAMGARAVALYTAPGSRFDRNVIITPLRAGYLPPNNTYVSVRAALGLDDAGVGLASWRLSRESQYRTSGAGASTPGADIDALIRRLAGVVPEDVAAAARRR